MMVAEIMDGKALAAKRQAEIAGRVAALTAEIGRPPGLAVLMVGDNPASAAYVRNKELACDRVGMASFGQHYPATATQEELTEAIATLNANPNVDGILVQLPLPPHLDAVALLNAIHPDKDADGLHPHNLGKLVRGEAGLQSCTPAGVMALLAEYDIAIAGRHAVVVGRSILVGKPLALMLLQADATVTIAHSRTPDLEAVTRSADIVIAAAGKTNLIGAEAVKPGATVIDVGINRITDAHGKSRLVGDVDFEAVQSVAAALTPVPGGVGPMTVTMLLHNTLWSYCRRYGQPCN